MSNISERAAYLRGLADGLGLDGQTPEQRVIREILKLLEDVGNEADKQQKQFAAIATRLNSLSTELETLQNDLYEEYDYEDDPDSPENLGRALGVIPSAPAAHGDSLSYLHCPHCGEAFLRADGDARCPHCGQPCQRP